MSLKLCLCNLLLLIIGSGYILHYPLKWLTPLWKPNFPALKQILPCGKRFWNITCYDKITFPLQISVARRLENLNTISRNLCSEPLQKTNPADCSIGVVKWITGWSFRISYSELNLWIVMSTWMSPLLLASLCICINISPKDPTALNTR